MSASPLAPTARAPLGVGFIGSGLVTQAIHLPTLARMRDDFEIRLVQDRNPEAAQLVAGRAGARWTSSLDELLGDPAIDVVAVCSPRQFHAEHSIAAMRAGKRAVFCEKPLAWSADEAREVARVSAETGVPVVVGAMHLFDRGWQDAAAAVDRLAQSAGVIRSSIVLPMTQHFVGWSTQFVPTGPWATPDPAPEVWRQRASQVREGVLELAIHDTPMIRRFLPDWRDLEVVSASPIEPFGYDVSLHAGGRIVTMVGLLHNHWRSRWELEVTSPDESLSVDFTPSWVHASSAVSRTFSRSGRTEVTGPYAANGYEGEWRAVAAAARGQVGGLPQLSDAVDDYLFAVAIADSAEQLLRKEAGK